VNRVSSFRYMGVHIAEDLTWTTHIDTLVRKVKQRLYHRCGSSESPRRILQTFYAGAVESILSGQEGSGQEGSGQILSGQEGSAEHALLALHSLLQEVYRSMCSCLPTGTGRQEPGTRNCCQVTEGILRYSGEAGRSGTGRVGNG